MRDHRSISIADQIFEQLEKDILTGKYQRGDTISELHLSQELGVSRTPIREALSRLQQEHILEDTGKGLAVVGITYEDMQDMYEIRIVIEGLAAAKAAVNISDESLKEMEDSLDMQKYYIEKQTNSGVDNSDKIKDIDSKFHELLYECSGSRAFADTLLPMHKKMTKFRKASVSKTSRAKESFAEHEAIFQALKEHDPEKARQLTEFHVGKARDRLKEMGDV